VAGAKLPLKLLVNLDGVFQSAKFSSPDVFSYLGKDLGKWIENLLGEFGVGDEPVIKGKVHAGAWVLGKVYIAEGAVVEPSAYIQGPCFIGPDAEVRHGAYIRGNVYVGARAVVGHTSEVKGSVLMDDAKAAHFAYVGDSFLGRHVNLGAGTKLANLKLKGDEVKFRHPADGRPVASGLRKFGAIMGDNAQTGCNAVLSPGTVMMPEATVLPCAHGRGLIKPGLL
jgi:NDP-sugar pyrophosphorylase family protein